MYQSLGLLQLLGVLLVPACLASRGRYDADDGFKLILFDAASPAVCIDGSPGGLYFRPGSGGGAFGADTWVIELEGGGWCVSLEDCANRAKTDIGSSKAWPPTGCPGMDGGSNGMLSSDCSVNPFCNATKAHFNYCDGGSFAGALAEPINGLYFRGAAIFDESVRRLLALGMSSAKNVILKGCSAGGLATYLHADYFHDAMATAAPQARVVAMPDAGFFRDHLTFDGTDYYTPLYKWVFQSMNVTQVDASCLAAYGGITSPTAWHCFFAEYTLPHISSPLFVTQDLVDSWQLTNIERLPCTPYKAGSCTPAELAALAAYRTSMLTALAPLINSPTNGAFLSSCIQHCHQNIGDVWSKELVANYTPRDAFVSWWSGARNVPSILVDGPFGTNAHCFGVPYEGEPTCGMALPVATLTTIDAGDARFVTPLGRTFAVGAGLGLSWLGGGFRVTHTGKVLRATVTTGASNAFKLSFSQSAEGYMPFQGISWVPASGMNESIVIASGAGTVDVTLNTPADYWARGNSAAVILSLTTDGTFTAAPPAPSRVLHILGDSITAATNIHGGVTKGCADGGYQADASSSWAGILCPFFSASCSTVAVGGKGLVRNCCDGGTKVPQFYTQLRKNDPDNSFAFKDATPDAMIVYLGTNDYSAGGSPALDELFTAGMLQLAHNVTRVYYGTDVAPANVTFFAVLGPMSPTLPQNAMLAAVEQGTALGYRIVFVNASTACGEDLGGCHDGCASHPGVASHRSIARMIAPYIASTLGWAVPGVL